MMLGSWDKLGSVEGAIDGSTEMLGPGDGIMLGSWGRDGIPVGMLLGL